MLTSTTLRRTASAVVCRACQASASSTRQLPLPSTRRGPPARPYSASYAQPDDTAISHDSVRDPTRDPDADPSADRDRDGASPTPPGATDSRDDAVTDWTHAEGALEDLFKAFGPPSSTSSSPTTPPAPSPSPSTSAAAPSPYKSSPIYADDDPAPTRPPPPPPAPAPVPTLDELIARPVDPAAAGPTRADLDALRPKRFSIPSATSPDSHRLIYRRVWDAAFDRINRAFSKRQVYDLAHAALALDVFAPTVHAKLRAGTRGKKPKWWRSKKLEQMSKRELIHAVLVGEWDLIDPDVVPHSVVKGGPTLTEAVPLSDRTLFLLLSPNCPVIPKIANHFGIKVSFARHPETQVLSLILAGHKAGVASARQEVDTLDEITTRQEFTLPKPATSLRPEVYQTISKLAKTFLEPGQHPDTLIASATEPKSLVRLERYLSGAFASDLVRQRSTALFASVAARAADDVRYALYPHEPVARGSTPGALASLRGTPTGGRGPTFARVRTVDHGLGAGDTALERWRAKMRLGPRDEPISVYVAEGEGRRRDKSIFEALFGPLEHLEDGRAEAVRYELRAEVGHVVFPVYPTGASGGGTVTGILDGPTPADGQQTMDWIRAQQRNDTVWLPSSSTIPVPVPISSPLSTSRGETMSPFSSLFSDPTMTTTARDDLAAESAFPTWSSTSMRRFTYYPSQLPSSPTTSSSPAASSTTSPKKNLVSRLEVTLDVDRGGASGPFDVALIDESLVHVAVPHRASDYRLKLRHARPVALGDVHAGGHYQLAPDSTLFETWSQHPSQSPFELEYDGTTYLLHSHSLVRQTTTTTALRAASQPGVPMDGYDVVQETQTHYLPEPMSSTDQVKTCEYVLTPSASASASPSSSSSSSSPSQVGVPVRAGGWTRDEIWHGGATAATGRSGVAAGNWNRLLHELEQTC
ncbi:hypothetical protein JCM11491_003813 [Sporobolomyces phaffii]